MDPRNQKERAMSPSSLVPALPVIPSSRSILSVLPQHSLTPQETSIQRYQRSSIVDFELASVSNLITDRPSSPIQTPSGLRVLQCSSSSAFEGTDFHPSSKKGKSGLVYHDQMDPLQPWHLRCKQQLPLRHTCYDGIVGAQTDDGQWVLTSPNVAFVPQPVLDRIRVEVKSDGRCGIADPIQWPQLFSKVYCHYALILHRPSDPNDPRQPIWWKPTQQDFVPVHASAVSYLGTLAYQPLKRLERLVEQMSTRIMLYTSRRGGTPTYINFCDLSMRAACNCLSFPSTYRDLVVQVVNVQRYWLESEAWLEYMENYQQKILSPPISSPSLAKECFMGTYTADPVVAFKLFSAGIPVWLIRSPIAITNEIAIEQVVLLTCPADIVVSHEGFGQLVYSGQVGEHHHAAINKGGHTYMDIPKIFLSKDNINPVANTNPSAPSQPTQLVPSSSSQSIISQSSSRNVNKATARSRTRSSHEPYRRDKRPSRATAAQAAVSQRDKFIEENHPLFPPRIPIWTESLAQVDRKVSALGKIDYFVPEPALLVGPSIRPTKPSYFRNWLRGREPWLHIITHSKYEQPPIHQQGWRDYLNHQNLDEAAHGTTHTARQKAVVLSLFKALSVDEDLEVGHEVEFYGRPFPLDSLDVQLCREVVWEVFEMGFRLELWALDKHICRPPSRSLYEQQIFEYERLTLISRVFGDSGHIRVATLPTGNHGLAATDLAARIVALEAFRRVLIRWPGAPAPLVATSISVNLPDRKVEEMERLAVTFYLDQFYIYSSRAAIVPHRFPL
ncbi:hypothetical protein NLI96_g12214 [Meripilus lineatus]|uniref:Uncharacterized protein n=1 Tax=Meripilus lineatus TaxID=2056292 RepID=A0AAD5YA30_9APHY|nr:hypothetical protein NLI96_g12214 [Physisporinus lineatus]